MALPQQKLDIPAGFSGCGTQGAFCISFKALKLRWEASFFRILEKETGWAF